MHASHERKILSYSNLLVTKKKKFVFLLRNKFIYSLSFKIARGRICLFIYLDSHSDFKGQCKCECADVQPNLWSVARSHVATRCQRFVEFKAQREAHRDSSHSEKFLELSLLRRSRPPRRF